MTRRRADTTLVDLGLFDSREKAKAAILAGRVRADGELVTKAGQPLDPDARVDLAEGPEFVSRGGLKLAGALDVFGLDPTGRRALDVGASTGGFTDCLLRRGAASVAAVDVGYGQLAWPLRNDERVTVFERTNIRDAKGEDLGAPFDLVTIDVSFIGLELVLPVVVGLLDTAADVLALVKPQFEAGRGLVGKRGVVRDPRVHSEVLARVADVGRRLGLRAGGLGWSPVKGPKGNIEFWVWFARDGVETAETPRNVVEAAHDALGG